MTSVPEFLKILAHSCVCEVALIVENQIVPAICAATKLQAAVTVMSKRARCRTKSELQMAVRLVDLQFWLGWWLAAGVIRGGGSRPAVSTTCQHRLGE